MDPHCHYCGVPLFKRGMPRTRGAVPSTKDHVVARALGGLDVKWNIVEACRTCNGNKADQYSDKWCHCGFCKRTRRRHWEMFGIRNPDGHAKSKRVRRGKLVK